MLRNQLKSKIHHARITACEVEYAGSIGISQSLLDQIDLWPGEVVAVWAVDHQARIETYVIPVAADGVIELRGGAAQHFQKGDRVVIAAFGLSETPITPKVITLNAHNTLI